MMYKDFFRDEGIHWEGPIGTFLAHHHGAFFGLAIIFGLLAIWSLAWKGMALWKAARKGDRNWFVVLLVVNTLGILEILYLYVFSKNKEG
jgi:hypothetical protein